VLDEPARQGTLFDLPLRKCWRGRDAGEKRSIFPSTCMGIGADAGGAGGGADAQLAQNIVLALLGGSRIID